MIIISIDFSSQKMLGNQFFSITHQILAESAFLIDRFEYIQIMKTIIHHRSLAYVVALFCFTNSLIAQSTNVIDNIVKEETENSQLKQLAHELFDQIGPRLVGSPLMKKANDWAVDKYIGWGITARNEHWGQW